MKRLTVITVQPLDLLFNWTLRVQLTNFRKYGLTENYRAIIWVSKDKIKDGKPIEWEKLEEDFPEVEFIYYWDHENFLRIIQNFGYIPLLRPYCLRKYFREHPELSKDAIFYIDADVVLTKPLEINYLIDDDINYMSQAGSYTNADYFDSKIKDVLPEKIESYKQLDVLDKTARHVGISREICVANNENTGAAQYLLKNLNEQYWSEVMDACMLINVFLRGINQKYFSSTNKGFQAWCADIWAVVWTLWKRGDKTLCPKELDFAWATDPISKWNEVSIYHDAGAVKNSKLFNKRDEDYVNNICTPFDKELDVDPNFCSYNYVQAIKEANPNKKKESVT